MEETSHNPRKKSTPKRVFRWLVILFIVLAATFGVNWSEVIATFSVAHVYAFAAAQPFQIVALILVSYRFGVLCHARRGSYRAVFRGYALALGLNSFIPGRLSELLKITYINKYSVIDSSTITAAVVSEKCIDLIILAVFLVLGFTSVPVSPSYKYGFLVVTMTGIVFLALLVFFANKTGLTQRLVAQQRAMSAFLGRTIHQLSQTLDPSISVKVFSISIIAWSLSYLVVYTIMVMLLSPPVSMSQAFVVFSAMAIGRAIPGLPGSLGTYEAAIVLAMIPLGYTAEVALAVALTMRASQLVLITIAGLLVLVRDGTGISSILSKQQEEPKVW